MSKLDFVSFGFLTGRRRLRSKESHLPYLLGSCLLVCMGFASSGVAQVPSQSPAASRGSQNDYSAGEKSDKSPSPACFAPEFLGTYNPDGRFSKASKRARLYNENFPEHGRSPRSSDLPPWVKLHSIESVVENHAPPARAVIISRTPSQLGEMRDSFLTAIYGHAAVLRAPTHIATDSKGRLIVSDPGQPAIHVLNGLDSFRIVAGPDRHVQRPNGLAIDAEDNIYVSDTKLALVQVFDPQGHFVRSIGDYKGESMFDHPTGIAIDRRAERLYVLDSRIGQLVILNLKGDVLARIGGHRHRDSKVKFVGPSEVIAGKNVVGVLDDANTRLQVLDMQGNLLRQITVRVLDAPPDGNEMGLAMDVDGRFYVSNINGRVQVFEPSGATAGVIERFGVMNERFAQPAGIWIDDGGRLYVADTNKARIAVFRTGASEAQEKRIAER